jgi:hypothetical protein
MNAKPTIDELRHDETLLRRTIAGVLNPGPWEHHWVYMNHLHKYCCAKCNGNPRKNEHTNRFSLSEQTPCPVPDPATGSLADLDEMLLRKTDIFALCKATFVMSGAPDADDPDEETRATCDAWGWRVFATTIDRIICSLLALDEAVVAKELAHHDQQ